MRTLSLHLASAERMPGEISNVCHGHRMSGREAERRRESRKQQIME